MSDIDERSTSPLFARSKADGIPKEFLNSFTKSFVMFIPNFLRS